MGLYRTPLILILLGTISLLPRAGWAQDASEAINTKQIVASPAQSVSIDGRLDEDSWQAASPISGFRQFEPDEGANATVKTDVRVLYGEGHLYVGAYLYDDKPDRIQATLGRRDDWNRADWFLVSIDSDLDRRQAFSFGVNAAGVQLDATRSGGGGGPGPGGLDTSWDAVWYSDVQVTSNGWVVELKIPYSMLRFSSGQTQNWGIHFTRTIPRLGEQAEWPLVPRDQRANLVSQFGRVSGLAGIESKRNVQVRPYTLSRAESRESTRNPGTAQWSSSLDAGGDVKIGLGSNSILDLTVNPDFGQVESDPAVLNLSAFETFFDEKRPFFVEGISKFEFSAGPGEMLYTRRIGEEAPIVGAAKFSGRTGSDFSYGVLGATTGDEFNPSRHYAVARGKQQIGSYSSIGGIMTGASEPIVDADQRRGSVTGGADWDLRFAGNQYGVEGFAAFTHLQRPSLDGGQATGTAGKVWLRKREGDWTGFVGQDVFGNQFNPNDLGQLRENNMVVTLTSINYDLNSGEPFGPFRRANVGTFTNQSWSYQNGLDRGFSSDINSNWILRGFQRVEVSMSIENPFGGYDLYETRGLGPWREPVRVGVGGRFETDRRRNWEVKPGGGYTAMSDGGREYALSIRGTVDVGTRLSLSGNVEADWERDVTAWSANETLRRMGPIWQIGQESGRNPSRFEPLATQLDDELQGVEPASSSPEEYVVPIFGARDTRSVDLTARGTITFTPHFSLQLYGQLFIAQGKYDNFQILRDGETLVPFEAYPKQDEFAIQSLQSNTVLRWQYRPGSTVFLVWSHGRRAKPKVNPLAEPRRSLYDRPFGDHVSDTFGLFGNNTFILKVSYTFLR